MRAFIWLIHERTFAKRPGKTLIIYLESVLQLRKSGLGSSPQEQGRQNQVNFEAWLTHNLLPAIPNAIQEMTMITWHPPSEGWITLNTDGSATAKATAGGLHGEYRQVQCLRS